MKGGRSHTAARAKARNGARYFTLEAARRSLPLVRRIVGDIVEQYRCVLKLEKERRALPSQGRDSEIRDTDERGHAAAARLAQLIQELNQIGCELKDLDKGLVDFPALHEGRRVDLCWMLGEESIDWWHETTAGFAGRQSVRGTLA